MKINRMLSMLVVLVLVLSALMVTTVVADRYVELDGNGWALGILSNNGFGSQARNLTCGEIITLEITDNSLDKNTNYRVGVWNGTDWRLLTTSGNRRSDDYGDLSISFRVPGWDDLGNDTISIDPVMDNGTYYAGMDTAGQWNISLFYNNFTGDRDDYHPSQQVYTTLNATIKIGNYYYLEFYAGGEKVDHLIYNQYYSDFYVKIFNWTSSGLVQAKDDATLYTFDVTMHNYSTDDGSTFPYTIDAGVVGGVTNSKELLIDDNIVTTSDKEKTFWIHVEHSTDPTLYSNISLPVLLDLTLPSPPTSKKWGDTISVSGAVLDGAGTGMKSYDVYLYSPASGGFILADSDTTSPMTTTGSYSISNVETGPGKGLSAGTWYVGTYKTGATGRVDMSYQEPYIAGFIPYHSFEVGSKDTAKVTVRNADDIVEGFTQTINISVDNATWMYDATNGVYYYQNMNVHITGIKGWDGTTAYDRTDKVCVLNGAGHGTTTSDKRSYYEFDYTFNETGTATIWVSWPGNLTDMDYYDSSYSNTYGNHSTSLKANITGTTTFSVVSPGPMTVLVDNIPETVEIKNAACGGGWVNKSSAVADGMWTNISVFGSDEMSHKNATISVEGCGLDFTINESDATDDNLIDYGWTDTGTGAWYNISLIPKKAGTLTITITNETDSDSVVKDYTVTGLTGSISTSIGDDLEITVGETETITLSGVSEYVWTKITFFNGVDKDVDADWWECVSLLNESEDAGDFSFEIDGDDIEQVGFIVVVAGIEAYDLYMYEIIEVVPIPDFTVEVTTPDAGNQTLTVGIEQDVIIELLDKDGDPVTDDDPEVEALLIDNDHDEDDPLQTFEFLSTGDGIWEATIHPWFAGQLVINGYNASDAIKHIGTSTLDVDYATIEYSPDGTTAGIGLEDLTIAVTAYDANGNPLDVSTLYLWAENGTVGVDLDFDITVALTDGEGEFDIADVGDCQDRINATLQDNPNGPADGNRTIGIFNINYPTFIIVPDTIYVARSNTVEIWVNDFNGDPVEGINITLIGNTITQPNPEETNADGYVSLKVDPEASGIANLTIARDLHYTGGVLVWANAVNTTSYVTITSIQEFTVTVSQTPIFSGETLTVSVVTGATPVSEANVKFQGVTKKTGSAGTAEFKVQAPPAETAVYQVEVTKTGFDPEYVQVTVIMKWNITIAKPSHVYASETFTVTVSAKGSALAGAAVSLDNGAQTAITDAQGKASFKAGAKGTTHTITADFGSYTQGTTTVTVEEKKTPGFELLTLIIAIGVAFILLRRRRN